MQIRDHKLRFKKKSLVSCVGVPLSTIIWNYMCWALAGKPEMKEKEIK